MKLQLLIAEEKQQGEIIIMAFFVLIWNYKNLYHVNY